MNAVSGSARRYCRRYRRWMEESLSPPAIMAESMAVPSVAAAIAPGNCRRSCCPSQWAGERRFAVVNRRARRRLPRKGTLFADAGEMPGVRLATAARSVEEQSSLATL